MAQVQQVDLAPGGEAPHTPADDALAVLLASMACSDGTIHQSEVEFLRKVRRDLPDDAAIEAWALSCSGPIDLQGLAAKMRSVDDRWKALRFAARMAWKDAHLADEEQAFLIRLAQALGLTPLAVDRVLREMSPDEGDRFTADRILKVVLEAHWDAVQLASGALCSEDLISVTPPRAEVVARVGLDKVEVMALCTEGLAARFQDGPQFIAWSELVTYTRSSHIGEALVLHTEDDRRFALVDQRLAGLAIVLDHLLDRHGKPRADNAPVVKMLRGDDDE
ncbi:MAG: TerB family tellurite resistance protein [Alphaproteobacteria bacterium]|nr:TerB family tellurite resistance protein [Alphaproteobacteria bacterium]MCB9695612.1 TerB family tellurite resistance protein [Alphaproteobacteria bacterium]